MVVILNAPVRQKTVEFLSFLFLSMYESINSFLPVLKTFYLMLNIGGLNFFSYIVSNELP